MSIFTLVVRGRVRLVVQVLRVGQELGLIHHAAVGVGVNEAVAHQVFQHPGIVVDLRLVPRVFQSDELALRAGRARRLGVGLFQKESTASSTRRQSCHSVSLAERLILISGSMFGAAKFAISRR